MTPNDSDYEEGTTNEVDPELDTFLDELYAQVPFEPEPEESDYEIFARENGGW